MSNSHTELLLCLCAMSLPVFAQSDPRAIGEEDKLAQPMYIAAPKFPERGATEKLPVEIRISGSVSEKGKMEAPVFSPLEGNEKYIRAIQDVLPSWDFRPAVDETTCAPARSDRVMTVWFEEKNGKPSVSVSSPVEKKSRVAADQGTSHIKPRTFAWRPKVEFPEAARRVGMEGASELLFMINQQGDVLEVKTLYSSPNIVFAEAALEGSKRVKFSPEMTADVPKRSTCILAPFSFCIIGGAEYPFPACTNRNRYPKKE